MIYIIAIILHFTFDWILQPRDIAKTKSSDIENLDKHLVYNIMPYIFILFSIIIINNLELFRITWFILIWSNVISHGLIDWYLPKLFKPEFSERRMINMVAVDQMLHLVILFLSIDYLI